MSARPIVPFSRRQEAAPLTPTQILAATWDRDCPVCEPHWPCTLHRQPDETKEQQR